MRKSFFLYTYISTSPKDLASTRASVITSTSVQENVRNLPMVDAKVMQIIFKRTTRAIQNVLNRCTEEEQVNQLQLLHQCI